MVNINTVKPPSAEEGSNVDLMIQEIEPLELPSIEGGGSK